MAKRQAEAKAAQEADKENPPAKAEGGKEEGGGPTADSGDAEPVFEENEVVLARDSGKLYDAKVKAKTAQIVYDLENTA